MVSSFNLSVNTGIGGNWSAAGFLKCGNRWAKFSGTFTEVGTGTTYNIGFYLNGCPKLINGKILF